MSSTTLLYLSYIVQALLRGAVWLLLLLFVTPLLRRVPAAGRAVMWQMGFVGLILLPLLLLWMPSLPLLQAKHSRVSRAPVATAPSVNLLTSLSATPIPSADAPAPSATLSPQTPVASPIVGAVPLPAVTPVAASATIQRGFSLFQGLLWLCSIWGVGAVGLLVRLGVGLSALRRLERGATAASEEWRGIAQTCADRSGLRRDVTLRIAAPATRVRAPITWGMRRPIVLLPKEYEQVSSAYCEAALLHEMAHIRRRDWAWLLLVQGLCALYWCVPFVWMAARRLTLEMELACDDCVLRAGVSAPDYATQILEVVRTMQTARIHPHIQAMPMARLPLSEARIRAILDPTRNRRPSSRPLLVRAALLPMLCLPILSLRAVAAPDTSVTPLRSPTRVPIAVVPSSSELAPMLAATPSLSLRKSASQPSLPVSRLANSRSERLSELPAESLRTAPIAPALHASAPPHQASSVIAWGPVVKGLQAGMRIVNGHTAFAPGEAIRQETYLRNRSRETVTIQVIDGYEEQGDPVLTDAKGAPVKVVRFFGEGFFASKLIPVHPGEIALVGRVAVVLHAPAPEADQPHEVAPGLSPDAEGMPYAIAGPGAYTLQQALAPMTAEGKPLLFRIRTAALSIQVDNVPPVQTVRVDHNKIADLATAPIAWGKNNGGLQAGLICLGEKAEFFIGERVRVAVVLRNVTKSPIRLEHQTAFAFLDAPEVLDAAGRSKATTLAPETEWKTIGNLRMTGVTYDMTYAPSADGPSSIRTSEIGPGQAVLGYCLTGFVVPERWKDGQPIPGRYMLKQTVHLRMRDTDAMDINMPLETAALPILLSDPDAGRNPSKRR